MIVLAIGLLAVIPTPSSPINFILPAFSATSGLSGCMAGYRLMKKLNKIQTLLSIGWLYIHLLLLIELSFATLISSGLQWTLVIAYLMNGATMSALSSQLIHQRRRKSIFGNYQYLNAWLAAHALITVLFSSVYPIGGDILGMLTFLSVLGLLAILNITLNRLME